MTLRLVTFDAGEGARVGAVAGDGLVDVTSRDRRTTSVRALLQAGDLRRIADLVEGCDADIALDACRLLPPVPDAEKILCIGVNYADRNAEYRDGSELPKYPSVFLRTRESLVGHGQPVLRPPESEQFDYEGEIAIVIGREGRRIPEARAHEYIAGLTLANEGSVRDWMRHGKFNVTQGKNFERSGALGPWLVSNDAFAAGYEDLRLTTRVNGEVRQDDTTANLLFSFRFLVSYLSTFMRLRPGDVISTGTPNGAGARFDPPRWLRPGDIVEVESPGVGVLRNVVADEAVAGG